MSVNSESTGYTPIATDHDLRRISIAIIDQSRNDSVAIS